MEHDFLRKLSQTTEANLSDPRFGVDELAGAMGMSRSSLLRKLHSYKGISINQYIREARLHRALEIITKEDVTASEVAYRTGFSSPGYFNTCFHEYFGYPPGEVRKMGNHFVGGGEKVDQVDEVDEVDKVDHGSKPLVTKILVRKWIKVTSTVVVVTVLALIFINIYWNTRPEKTIAVLPFGNVRRDTALQPWVTGLELQLYNDLAKIKVFKVKARVSANKFLDSNKTMAEIGNELKADYLVKGTFDKVGDSLKIWIQVIRARTGEAYLPETYTLKMKDFFNLQAEIARDIATKLNTALSRKENKELDRSPTQNPEAYKNYLLGLHYAERKRGYSKYIPVGYFQKAIDLDPRFALAYVGIADAWIYQIRLYPDFREETLKAGKAAIDKALEIDPVLPAAHNALGNYHWLLYDYGKAMQEFKFVIKSNPDNIEALYNIGTLSRITGDWKQAINSLEKAISLDPQNAPYGYELGRTFMHLRDYARAVEQFNRAKTVEPSYVMSDHGLVDLSLLWKGDTGKAREILEKAARWYPKYSIGNVFDQSRFLFQRTIIDLYEGKNVEALDHLSQISDSIISIPPPYHLLFQPKYWYYSIIYRLMNKPDLERSYYDSSRIYIENKLPARARENPNVICALGIAYAGLGNSEKAIELGEKAVNLLPISKNEYAGPGLAEGLAFIYMIDGKYTEALKILDHLLSIPGFLTVRILEMDPRWEPLKDLPEYKRILKKFSVQ